MKHQSKREGLGNNIKLKCCLNKSGKLFIVGQNESGLFLARKCALQSAFPSERILHARHHVAWTSSHQLAIGQHADRREETVRRDEATFNLRNMCGDIFAFWHASSSGNRRSYLPHSWWAINWRSSLPLAAVSKKKENKYWKAKERMPFQWLKRKTNRPLQFTGQPSENNARQRRQLCRKQSQKDAHAY